ncbi:hypothetical protein M569_06567, partial [Genlisea aurea]
MEEEDAEVAGGLLRWAAAVGISDCPMDGGDHRSRCLGNSLMIFNFPEAGGRGLAAVRCLRKGEMILRVPKVALMTSDCLMAKDERLCAAFRKYPSLSRTQTLAVCLLNEVRKGKSSWWYPYIQQLPRTYDLLAHFSSSEIQAFQIDDAIWSAERAVLRATSEWKEATPLMKELCFRPQFLTFKAWLWASSTISSRTMHIPWDSAGCLCPVGDFFNYAPPQQEEDSSTSVARYDEITSCYCFCSNRNYDAGDQVLLSYGAYTNLELIEHYGFLLRNNSNDKAFIPLEPEILALCPWPPETLYISRDGKPSFALLSTLRLWATPIGRRRWAKQLVYSGNPLSEENEEAVRGKMIDLCCALLSKCSTSIDEDEGLVHEIEKKVD